MARGFFFTLLMFVFSLHAGAQNGFIVVKKGYKTVRYFAKNTPIVFELQNGEWLAGTITKVLADSFYFTQEIIRYYTIGTDTLRYYGLAFSLNDIKTLPSKNMRFVYVNDRVRIVPGREKWVWARNGLLFRMAGAGYVALNIVNDLYRKDPPFTSKKLPGLAAGGLLYFLGEFLHRRFDPYIRIGKKYHLEAFVF